MISKQLKLIICGCAAVIILIGALIAVKVLVKEPTSNKPALELLDGEGAGTTNKPRIVPAISESEVQSVTISNGECTFTVERDAVNNTAYIKDNKEFPIDTDKISRIYSFLSRLVVTRVDTEPEDLGAYGIGKDSAYIEIKKKDGAIVKLNFGQKANDGQSYYVACEGRNVLYSMKDNLIDKVVFSKPENYISPIAAPTLDDISYVEIERFSIKHGKEDFIAFKKIDDEYKASTGYTLTHIMTYPASYLIDLDNFEKLLSCFSSLYGTEVVGFGYERDGRLGELSSYGFDENMTTIEYSFAGVPTILYVGGKTADGSGYYVYTLYYDTLLIITDDSLPFLEWELGDYIGKDLFQMAITNVKSIEVSSEKISAQFVLEEKDGDLNVYANGKKLAEDESGSPMNFRQFYINLLHIPWDGYADKEEKYDKSGEYMSLKVTSVFGEVFEYKFCKTSALRCRLIYNGDDRFYTEKATLDAFLANLDRVMKDETVILE